MPGIAPELEAAQFNILCLTNIPDFKSTRKVSTTAANGVFYSDGNFYNPLIKNPLVKAVAWLTNKQGPC
jgi:hypothetical protein